MAWCSQFDMSKHQMKLIKEKVFLSACHSLYKEVNFPIDEYILRDIMVLMENKKWSFTLLIESNLRGNLD